MVGIPTNQPSNQTTNAVIVIINCIAIYSIQMIADGRIELF